MAAARATGALKVNAAVIDALSSLMLVAAVALILPTVLYATFPAGKAGGGEDIGDKVLSFSRATATVLLSIYGGFLYFQFRTHPGVFLNEDEDVDHDVWHEVLVEVQEEDEADGEAVDASESDSDEDGDDAGVPLGSVYIPAGVLLASAAMIILCTHNLILTLDDTTRTLGITKAFVAIILIPLASNASELSQVVAASRCQKINFAIGVIIGSILQVALFVLPLLVLVGWITNRAMDMYFETSQTCVLLLAVLVVNQVLQDGQYTFFHGVMLLSM